MSGDVIYLDNAATSWPKPPGVAQAIVECLEREAGNPGRSGHRLSLAAGRRVYAVREAVAELFGAPDPVRVIFTHNGTMAVNMALGGLLAPGDRVVCTGMEHNAVMRPLRDLEAHGVTVVVAPCDAAGRLDLDAFARAVEAAPTRMVVLNHASNVTGTLCPVAEAAAVARRAGALVLLDAAQTAGTVPIDMEALGVDLLAFTGHKGLLGPSGTGGLILGERVNAAEMVPLLRGGTGSRSAQERQPPDLPDRFEAGTVNFAGIAGLGAGLEALAAMGGPAAVGQREGELAQRLWEGLSEIPGVRLYGSADRTERVAVVSFTIDGLTVSEVGCRLDDEYGILTRVGLHCAPSAHRTIGTFPTGTVRLSPGPFTTVDQIDRTIQAVRAIARGV
ncbi:aminotransferase class V-fold PLP-dependent enzyme [Symbiobacterium terraclitae]|uniref:aminotransferase class V-fold PLP-dependent enzyme n=1 Tax=Symbiobacterium terraclitae TaxID=557451 RepID=UPI0035B52985